MGRARASGEAFPCGRGQFHVSPRLPFQRQRTVFSTDPRTRFLESSMMSNAPFSRPLGTAMVGGAIAMATLEVLVQKNVLSVDDVHTVLKTAQSTLVNAPTVQGSLDA